MSCHFNNCVIASGRLIYVLEVCKSFHRFIALLISYKSYNHFLLEMFSVTIYHLSPPFRQKMDTAMKEVCFCSKEIIDEF